MFCSGQDCKPADDDDDDGPGLLRISWGRLAVATAVLAPRRAAGRCTLSKILRRIDGRQRPPHNHHEIYVVRFVQRQHFGLRSIFRIIFTETMARYLRGHLVGIGLALWEITIHRPSIAWRRVMGNLRGNGGTGGARRSMSDALHVCQTGALGSIFSQGRSGLVLSCLVLSSC